nr:DUF5655 domain-containing protein [uncultured Gemmiger sp.]
MQSRSADSRNGFLYFSLEAVVEAYPGRWTHHVLIDRQEAIDEELMSWIQEAYAFSASK